MRKIILIIFISIMLPVSAKSADSRTFEQSADNIYVMSLNTLKKLNFRVVEMQSASGYILFQATGGAEYLISISENGENSSILKISKVKPASPLREVQELFYNSITEELTNLPKRAE